MTNWNWVCHRTCCSGCLGYCQKCWTTIWLDNDCSQTVLERHVLETIVFKLQLHPNTCMFQAFGGAGVSMDTPLAILYTHARTLRLADGPDEVHRRAIAKSEYRKGGKGKLWSVSIIFMSKMYECEFVWLSLHAIVYVFQNLLL